MKQQTERVPRNLVARWFGDNLENIEDPGFVDAAKQDFRLREDSAVLKLPGWERIPIERIGLYKDEYRAD